MSLGRFEVYAGDFVVGGLHQVAGDALVMKAPTQFFREKIPLKAIESIEIASVDSVKRLGGTLGWGAAGLVALGPLGLLAGLVAGGLGKDVMFACTLKDGRKFVASAPSKVYAKIAAKA